jgi:hypothetical protein
MRGDASIHWIGYTEDTRAQGLRPHGAKQEDGKGRDTASGSTCFLCPPLSALIHNSVRMHVFYTVQSTYLYTNICLESL